MKFINSKNRRSFSTRIFALMLALILCLLAGCTGQTEPEAPEGSGPSEEVSQPVNTGTVSDNEPSEQQSEEQEAPEVPEGNDRMVYAHVNGKVLKILAAENSSADAFLDLLKAGDVTVEMHDYGSFEKVGPLGTTLPRNDEQITTEPGDVILYQGNQVTIYYDVNSWSFTRLGKVQGLSQAELKEILGSGNAAVTFSLSEGTGGTGSFDFEKHTVLLNSGYEMPIIGLGTWTLSDDAAENSVYHALKSGMRLIDTARYYGNEVGVGRGLRKAFCTGHPSVAASGRFYCNTGLLKPGPYRRELRYL